MIAIITLNHSEMLVGSFRNRKMLIENKLVEQIGFEEGFEHLDARIIEIEADPLSMGTRFIIEYFREVYPEVFEIEERLAIGL